MTKTYKMMQRAYRLGKDNGFGPWAEHAYMTRRIDFCKHLGCSPPGDDYEDMYATIHDIEDSIVDQIDNSELELSDSMLRLMAQSVIAGRQE